MKKYITVCVLILFIGFRANAKYEYIQKPLISEANDVLVGISYYPGWWQEEPNNWQDRKDGHDWRKDYPERVPLLGVVTSQETMDKEIDAATNYGVDFFAMLWYYSEPNSFYNFAINSRFNILTETVDFFMRSPNSHKMKFLIEVCNHPPFSIKDEKVWGDCVDVWVKAMKHPSYLRVGGKPVIKLHDGSGGFLADCGGSLQNCQRRIKVLRDKARQNGLGEILIGAGNTGPIWEDHWVQKVFDFSNDYMASPADYYKESEKLYRYDWLCRVVDETRGLRRFDMIPYVPMLSSGWNPRPWHDSRPAFESPAREEWKRELIRMAKDLEYLPNMGLLLPNGKRQKIFNIYAWNEFGEGGYVAPTKGDGYMKLECIREVFGVKKPN